MPKDDAEPKDPRLVEAEIRKTTAEAAKAEAEAEAERLRAEADVQHMRHMIREQSARAVQAELELVKIKNDADRENEKRRDELASDKFHHRYIFDTEVTEGSVKKCIAQMALWERSSSEPLEIELVINSPGGSVVDGFALIDYINGMHARGHVVNTVAYGMAASMGGVILQAGKKRSMGANAVLLIHEAQFGAVGCPAPYTKVLTSDLRWVEAGSLRVGDSLLAFDEHSNGSRRKWRHAKVEAVGRAQLPCSRVTLEDGRVIVVSDNHPWLVSRPTSAEKGWNSVTSWRETRDLFEYPGVGGRRGLKATRLVDAAPVALQDESWSSGYIGGLLDGEGSLPRGADNRISFSQNRGPVLDFFVGWMEQNGFIVKDYTPAEDKCRHLRITGDEGGRGLQRTLELLMRTRPQRLVNALMRKIDGKVFYQRQSVGIASVEPIGVQEVVTLKTSTGTFIGEGIAMHNSYGEIQDRVKLVDIFHERILALFTNRSKVTKQYIKSHWARTDWWIDAETSLKHGFVDEIV